jgi:hypothetical protein
MRPRLATAVGFVTLVTGGVLSVYPYALGGFGWILVAAGAGLCSWASFCWARNRRTQLPSWSRWILVLPGATVALLWIALVVVGLVRMIPTSLASEPFQDVCTSALLIVGTILGACGFVLAGAGIAPKWRFAVALLLTAAYVCGSGYFLFAFLFSVTYGAAMGSWPNLWWFLVPWIAGSVAAAGACAWVWRRRSRVSAVRGDMSEMEAST